MDFFFGHAVMMLLCVVCRVHLIFKMSFQITSTEEIEQHIFEAEARIEIGRTL